MESKKFGTKQRVTDIENKLTNGEGNEGGINWDIRIDIHTLLCIECFPGSSAGKESTYNAEDPGSIPGSGRFPREGRDRLPTPVFLGFPGGSAGKEFSCNVGDLGSVPGWEDPLEKGTATHSSILALRIHSMGSQKVRHVWMTFTSLHFQGPPTGACISQSRWILAQRPMGGLTSPTMEWHPIVFFISEEPLCSCVVGRVSLNSRSMGAFISDQGRAHTAILECLHRGWTQPEARLVPASLPTRPLRDMPLMTSQRPQGPWEEGWERG